MQTAFASAPGLLLLLAVVGARPGIAYDSVYYLAAADSLSATGRLVTPIATHAAVQFAADGTLIREHPFVTWPPGFPIALGLVRALGLDIERAVVAVNAIALMMLVFASFQIARTVMPAGRAGLVAACVGVLPTTQSLARMAWSETLFIAIAAMALLQITRWTAARDVAAQQHWIAAGVLGALATSIRYIGVTVFIVQGLAAIAFGLRGRSTRERRGVAAGLLVGPIAVAGFLMVRSIAFQCWPCDTRVVDVTGPAGHVEEALRAAISFAPVVRAWPGWLDSIASVCVLAGLAAWFEARRDRRPVPAQSSAPILVAVFAACHAAALIVARVLTYFDPIDERLMSPALVFGSLAGLLFVFRRLPDDARGFGIALVAYLALVTVVDSASPTMRWRTLNDATVRNAPLSRAALQAADAGALVLSSDVPRLTWQTRRPTYWLPSLDVLRRFAASNEFVVLLADESSAEPDVIAWLNATAAHQSAGDGYRLWRVRALSTATSKA